MAQWSSRFFHGFFHSPRFFKIFTRFFYSSRFSQGIFSHFKVFFKVQGFLKVQSRSKSEPWKNPVKTLNCGKNPDKTLNREKTLNSTEPQTFSYCWVTLQVFFYALERYRAIPFGLKLNSLTLKSLEAILNFENVCSTSRNNCHFQINNCPNPYWEIVLALSWKSKVIGIAHSSDFHFSY